MTHAASGTKTATTERKWGAMSRLGGKGWVPPNKRMCFGPRFQPNLNFKFQRVLMRAKLLTRLCVTLLSEDEFELCCCCFRVMARCTAWHCEGLEHMVMLKAKLCYCVSDLWPRSACVNGVCGTGVSGQRKWFISYQFANMSVRRLLQIK